MNLLEKARKTYEEAKVIAEQNRKIKELEHKKVVEKATLYFTESVNHTVLEAAKNMQSQVFYSLGTDEKQYFYFGLDAIRTKIILMDVLRESGVDFCSHIHKTEDHTFRGFMISGWAENES